MSSLPVILSLILGGVLAVYLPQIMFGKKWNPKGQHCYVTGGTSGLGLSLAVLLTKKGAHVSVVARDTVKMENALKEIEAARQNPEQILKGYPFALDTLDASTAALEAACAPHGGRSPAALFLCAGTSRPGFFVEQDEASLTNGMTQGYWIQAWTALAASKKMVRESVQGKIVFVASTLAYTSFVGWSPYSPAKHALRGLADTLRSELLLYSIDVHIFFPGTILSPGLVEENKVKPKLTSEIEGDDEGLTPEQAAQGLFRGVEKGQAHISADFNTTLFRVGARGATPSHNPIVDTVLGLIAWVGFPIWRWGVDSKVKGAREEHHKYLVGKGLVAQSS